MNLSKDQKLRSQAKRRAQRYRPDRKEQWPRAPKDKQQKDDNRQHAKRADGGNLPLRASGALVAVEGRARKNERNFFLPKIA